MSNKTLLPKMYKSLLKFNNKKPNNLIKKWAKNINRYLPHQRIHTVGKEEKKKRKNIKSSKL